MLGIAEPAAAAESHFRYLSGLLLGIGLCFVAMVPRIEFRCAGFRLLAIVVVIGGSARLLSVALHGTSDRVTLFALLMELVVTPSLALWQMRVANSAREGRCLTGQIKVHSRLNPRLAGANACRLRAEPPRPPTSAR